MKERHSRQALRRALSQWPSDALVRRIERAAGPRALGWIAAIDPVTRQFFLARTVIEAARKGRLALDDPRRQFLFIRIGSKAVHALRVWARS